MAARCSPRHQLGAETAGREVVAQRPEFGPHSRPHPDLRRRYPLPPRAVRRRHDTHERRSGAPPTPHDRGRHVARRPVASRSTAPANSATHADGAAKGRWAWRQGGALRAQGARRLFPECRGLLVARVPGHIARRHRHPLAEPSAGATPPTNAGAERHPPPATRHAATRALTNDRGPARSGPWDSERSGMPLLVVVRHVQLGELLGEAGVGAAGADLLERREVLVEGRAEAAQAVAVAEPELGGDLVLVEQADVVQRRAGSGSAGSISIRRYRLRPVAAGISLPMITFSLAR